MQPFNIDILILNKVMLAQLKEVTNLAIMESGTQNFAIDGLYSTEIFGPIGSDIRNKKFGYVDLNIKVLHPLIYQHIISLKKLYKDIIEGKKYGIWDEATKDIVESDRDNGGRGLDFMLKYIDKIDLKDNGSDERMFKIEMVKRYSGNDMLLDKWLVLPAGLRDYTVGDNGRPTEDEVNDIYRKLMGTVNVIRNISVKSSDMEILNPIRVKIQNTILELYEHFKMLTDGKNKFIQGKWAKRAITHGTRNVITAIPIVYNDINQTDRISFNDTIVGLYQYIAGIAPITKNKVNTHFISRVLTPGSDMANLIDPKTLKTAYVSIDAAKRDDWLSDEGMDGIISKMGQEINRKEPVMIDKYYLALVYDDGRKVEVIFNTDTMDPELNPRYLRPITYAEMFYISVYDVRNKYPAFVTRYPVASLGGIYPSKIYLKTTTNARTVKFKMNGVEKIISEYPILKESFFNSLSPGFSKLQGLGGDYDGKL